MRDTLTGLQVRWFFLEQLAHALARLARTRLCLAVLLVDLDGLKNVNDTFGHSAGDRLITVSVDRIRASLRPVDLPARIGGDEFVVLLEDLDRADDAVPVARRILDDLARPCRLEGTTISPVGQRGCRRHRRPRHLSGRPGRERRLGDV